MSFFTNFYLPVYCSQLPIKSQVEKLVEFVQKPHNHRAADNKSSSRLMGIAAAAA